MASGSDNVLSLSRMTLGRDYVMRMFAVTCVYENVCLDACYKNNRGEVKFINERLANDERWDMANLRTSSSIKRNRRFTSLQCTDFIIGCRERIKETPRYIDKLKVFKILNVFNISIRLTIRKFTIYLWQLAFDTTLDVLGIERTVSELPGGGGGGGGARNEQSASRRCRFRSDWWNPCT